MTESVLTLRALGRETPYRGLKLRTPDGLNICAQDWSRTGSGRDVLLIHGYSQSHLSWLKQVSGPLANEFRLVTYDIRGHGGSDKPLEPHYYREPERWAGEVEAVMRAARLERPVVVFWSYAGRIALDYLSARGDREVAGLVFVNATSKSDVSVQGPATPLLARMTQDDLASNIEATVALLGAASARALPMQELCYMLAFNMVVPPAVRANLLGRAAEYEATLRALNVPVLAIHGSEDPVTLPSLARYTASTVRNGRSIIYPGVGHMPFWEISDMFDRDLAAFIREAA